MLSAEGIGRNIEQAIENALFELKAPREDVDIKIINEGRLFKKAKVLVTISEDARAKYEKKKPIERLEEKVAERMEKSKAKSEKKEEKESAKEEKKAQKEEKKEEKLKAKAVEMEKPIVVEELDDDEDENLEEREGMDPVEFLKGLFEVAGKEVEINISNEDDKYITYSVTGENLGDMIGHRGDCYYAINRILTAVAGKTEKRILLDIGGYREKRAESLTALAKRTAERVAKTGRYARLDPMNPSDRRIIHSALSDDERVVTLSKGEDPRRYVMIFPKDED